MAVFSFGSINVDHFYKVSHLPERGETVLANDHSTGLGGKGANQSVAAAQAGATVTHIGMIGQDGDDVCDRLEAFGVDVRHVGRGTDLTGNANIFVDAEGENMIVVSSGANQKQSLSHLKVGLDTAVSGDFMVLQNEVNLTQEAAELARTKGMVIVYSAAPFDAEKTLRLLKWVDVLVVNEVEAAQLSKHLGRSLEDAVSGDLIVTKGAQGAYYVTADGARFYQPAFEVDVVDTTAAGDCFIGYVVAGLSEGLGVARALKLGAAASALKVQRPGTAKAIPGRSEVDAFLALKD